MPKKLIIITGASDGIGAAAARLLTARGEQVVLVGHTEQKTKLIAQELNSPYFTADFANLDEVKTLAAQLTQEYPTINVLVNNAGGIFGKRELTADGHEKTMQVNYLAHFLLTNLLLKTLLRNNAAVINTSSAAHAVFSDLHIDDLEMEKNYTAVKAYGNSKLENILFTKELHRRFHAEQLSAAAFHPGNVATNFAKSAGGLPHIIWQTPVKHLAGLIRPEQGADTLVWLATTQPGEDWQSGEYYAKRQIAKAAKAAYDAQLAKTLWEKSEIMIAMYR